MSSEEFSSKPTVQSDGSRGRPPEPPQPDEIAPLFPNLEILEIIGWGGMGVVYRARQRSLDRVVALKLLLPDPDRSPTFAERFSREARALAQLQHPNIVTVYDSGQADQHFYFIMEYVDGANLRQMLDTEEMSPQQALTIVPTICDALQYAHEEGIAHRDIKPENILIDRRGRVKIADFGLAKLINERHTDYTMLTMPNQVMGTMHYMAPEQIEHPDQVDHRADIYALGVVLYEMLTGELPIGRFPLPSEKTPPEAHVDTRIDEVVLRALEKEPDRRYQQVSEVKTDLEHATSGVHANGGPPGAPGVSGLPDGQSIPVAAAPAAPQRPLSPSVFAPPADPAAGSTFDHIKSDLSDIAFGRRNIGVAYLLWLIIVVTGLAGIHRMYCGRWISGIIWLLTGGLFLVGQFIDLFLIPEMVRRANWERQMRAAQMQ